jgi:hypothetical protein
LGSDWLPPLAGRKSKTDNSANQGANWWAIEKSENPSPADVGVKRVTGSCVVYTPDDEAGQRPNSKPGGEMFSSRGSAKNFKAIDFASAISESNTVRTSLYNERVCGKLAQMPDSRKTVCSQYEPNGCAVCNCRWRNRASRGDPRFHWR